MGKFIFIIGGARSGKSRYAKELAKKMSRKVCFIATCIPMDSEMRKRAALHRKSRPDCWKTKEAPKDLTLVLRKTKAKFDVVIIDCLGLFISNLLCGGLKEKKIEKEVKSIAQVVSKHHANVIVVSNDVGTGLVPDNPLGRKFRDLVGLSNQIMAKKADIVYMMHTGIPVRIK